MSPKLIPSIIYSIAQTQGLILLCEHYKDELAQAARTLSRHGLDHEAQAVLHGAAYTSNAAQITALKEVRANMVNTLDIAVGNADEALQYQGIAVHIAQRSVEEIISDRDYYAEEVEGATLADHLRQRVLTIYRSTDLNAQTL